jgi:hypothetical protein
VHSFNNKGGTTIETFSDFREAVGLKQPNSANDPNNTQQHTQHLLPTSHNQQVRLAEPDTPRRIWERRDGIGKKAEKAGKNFQGRRQQ